MHVLNRSERMERMSDYLRCETARSLDLLRAIDGTIETLTLIRRQMDAFSEALDSLIAQTNSVQGVFPEAEIIPALEESQELVKPMHRELMKGLDSAGCSTSLKGDDGVVEAYGQAIDAVLSYSHKLEQFKWTILEHNADMEGAHQPKIARTDDEIDSLLDNL